MDQGGDRAPVQARRFQGRRHLAGVLDIDAEVTGFPPGPDDGFQGGVDFPPGQHRRNLPGQLKGGGTHPCGIGQGQQGELQPGFIGHALTAGWFRFQAAPAQEQEAGAAPAGPFHHTGRGDSPAAAGHHHHVHRPDGAASGTGRKGGGDRTQGPAFSGGGKAHFQLGAPRKEFLGQDPGQACRAVPAPVQVDGPEAGLGPLLPGRLDQGRKPPEQGPQRVAAGQTEAAPGILDGHEQAGPLGEARRHGPGRLEGLVVDGQSLFPAGHRPQAAEEDDRIGRGRNGFRHVRRDALALEFRHQGDGHLPAVGGHHDLGGAAQAGPSHPQGGGGHQIQDVASQSGLRLAAGGGRGGGGNRSGSGRGLRLRATQIVHDLGQGAHGAQANGIQRRQALGLCLDRGQDLHPFDGVDPQLRLHVHGEIEQVQGIAGLFGHHRQHQGLEVQGSAERWRSGSRRGWSGLRLGGARGRQALQVVHDLCQGAHGAQGHRVHRGHTLGLFQDRGQDLHPLDGIDPQLRFHVHGEVEHVLGVAGLFRHHGQHERLEIQAGTGR